MLHILSSYLLIHFLRYLLVGLLHVIALSLRDASLPLQNLTHGYFAGYVTPERVNRNSGVAKAKRAKRKVKQ